MAEKRTRRRFTAEFEAEAVERLLEGGKGLSEVGSELGLSPGQLNAWWTEHLAAGGADPTRGGGGLADGPARGVAAGAGPEPARLVPVVTLTPASTPLCHHLP